MNVKRLLSLLDRLDGRMLAAAFWLAWRRRNRMRHDLDAPEQATRLGQTIGTVTGIVTASSGFPMRIRRTKTP